LFENGDGELINALYLAQSLYIKFNNKTGSTNRRDCTGNTKLNRREHKILTHAIRDGAVRFGSVLVP